MNLATVIRGERFVFADLREVFAKANEEKSGDQLAGLAAATERERVAAKLVLADLTLAGDRRSPADRSRRRRGEPADPRPARREMPSTASAALTVGAVPRVDPRRRHHRRTTWPPHARG